MGQEYQRGYDAALVEIYAASIPTIIQENCGSCRACGVIRSVIEETFVKLGELLTDDEFKTLSRMILRLNQ